MNRFPSEWWEIDEPDPDLRAEARMGAPKQQGVPEEAPEEK